LQKSFSAPQNTRSQRRVKKHTLTERYLQWGIKTAIRKEKKKRGRRGLRDILNQKEVQLYPKTGKACAPGEGVVETGKTTEHVKRFNIATRRSPAGDRFLKRNPLSAFGCVRLAGNWQEKRIWEVFCKEACEKNSTRKKHRCLVLTQRFLPRGESF